jgi:tRNA A-37 threonylcarbamoyl transferase component Bud32
VSAVPGTKDRKGERVGERYELLEYVGEGGSGVVYRARQRDIAREVAIKFLRRSDDAAARARFAREARVAARLEHPDAVAIYELGQHKGESFIAMEFAVGRSLRARIHEVDAPLAWPEAARIARCIADVLAAAHSISLVHRDLKPENIVLAEGRVRVLDFGLAFVGSHDDDARDDRMTAMGVVAGTAAYLSPEQARGGEVGPETDIYALGCMLMEMLTGSPPFQGSELEVLTKQLYAPAPPLRSTGNVSLPASLEPLIEAMLQKRASQRPSATEVGESLQRLDETGRATSAGSRTARMVPEGAQPATNGTQRTRGKATGSEREIAIVGAIDGAVLLGLSALGFVPFVVTDEEPLGQPAAIVAIGDQDIAALSQVAPVIADVDVQDLPRMQALLAGGALEVVPKPLTVDALAARIERALRKQARR